MICSVTQQDAAAQSRVGTCPRTTVRLPLRDLERWWGSGGCILAISEERGAKEGEAAGFCLKPPLILPHAPPLIPLSASQHSGLGGGGSRLRKLQPWLQIRREQRGRGSLQRAWTSVTPPSSSPPGKAALQSPASFPPLPQPSPPPPI